MTLFYVCPFQDVCLIHIVDSPTLSSQPTASQFMSKQSLSNTRVFSMRHLLPSGSQEHRQHCSPVPGDPLQGGIHPLEKAQKLASMAQNHHICVHEKDTFTERALKQEPDRVSWVNSSGKRWVTPLCIKRWLGRTAKAPCILIWGHR